LIDPPRRRFGLRAGAVFPAANARSLLNPLRRIVQPPRATVRALQLRLQDRVIEIGSGPGYFSPDLASSVPRGRLVLVDVQPAMLQFARSRLVEAPHAMVVAADAQYLPFRAASFDVAFLATMLGEVPDLRKCLIEVHHVLSSGGVLAVAETRRDADFISLDSLRRLIESSGFAFLDRSGNRWQYVARFSRT
jgi:ubiquinone/menaquinone biosynthesis C-methylase UbiE